LQRKTKIYNCEASQTFLPKKQKTTHVKTQAKVKVFKTRSPPNGVKKMIKVTSFKKKCISGESKITTSQKACPITNSQQKHRTEEEYFSKAKVNPKHPHRELRVRFLGSWFRTYVKRKAKAAILCHVISEGKLFKALRLTILYIFTFLQEEVSPKG